MHFAYPKVDNKEFIGCGRYIALSRPRKGYDDATPQSASPAKVRAAASELTRGLPETDRRVFEEVKNADYDAGDSQALAYLLALINCKCNVKRISLKGEIWCAGSIDLVHGKTPFLEIVTEGDFDIKLDAFVFEQQRGNLFIVPSANITTQHEKLLREEKIRLISLSAFQKGSLPTRIKSKTVLKVEGHELELLRDVLFEIPTSKIWRRTTILFCVVFLAILMGFLWTTYRKNQPYPAITIGQEKGPRVEVQARLRQEADGSIIPLTNDSTLSAGSQYQIVLTPLKTAYMYIFQLDVSGQICQLFPSIGCLGVLNEHNQNPAQQGKTYYLPDMQEWFTIESQTSIQALYFLVFNGRNTGLEGLYQKTLGIPLEIATKPAAWNVLFHELETQSVFIMTPGHRPN